MKTLLLALVIFLAPATGGSAAAPFSCDSALLNQTGDVDEARVMDAARQLEDAGDLVPRCLQVVRPLGQFVEVVNDAETPVEWITKRKPIEVKPGMTVRLEVGNTPPRTQADEVTIPVPKCNSKGDIR